jgi:putative tricarboxylic transport membrane protein
MAVGSFSSWVAGPGQVILPLAAAGIVVVAWLLVRRSLNWQFTGRITLDVALLALGLLAFVLTAGFPTMSFKGVDARMVPRVWSILLMVLAAARLAIGLLGKDVPDPKKGRLDKVLLLLALLVLKIIGITWVGYFISAGLFVLACAILLGYKNPVGLIACAGGWVAFSYLVFYKLLSVPLPTGILFETIF